MGMEFFELGEYAYYAFKLGCLALMIMTGTISLTCIACASIKSRKVDE